MNIAGLQFDIGWENKRSNYATVRRMLEESRIEPDTLVVLPEMFATGFSMNTAALAEDRNGPTEQFLAGLAAEFRVWILAGVAMRGLDGRARNEALVFSSAGQRICEYAKMRLFTPGDESTHYAPGDQVQAFQLGDARVAPFICYDLRFPELFRQAAARCRPELFVVIASFPQKRVSHWIRLLQARAIENQAYVLGVNRVGADPFYSYNGRSLIADPQGEIIADAGEAPGIVQARLDLSALRKYREGLPFLDDLR
jgi:predicted amidohydrolase